MTGVQKCALPIYLERIPGGYISNQQELIEKLKRKELGLPEQAVLPGVNS